MGAAAFSALLMLKHLYLCLAPVYFVYLLFGYCWNHAPSRKFSVPRFFALGITVVAVVVASAAPFFIDAAARGMEPLELLQQMASRLFPFGPKVRRDGCQWHFRFGDIGRCGWT